MQQNPLYETIIDDLLANQYAVCDTFFSKKEVSILRNELNKLRDEAKFKKAAIGNLQAEKIMETVRGDAIFWIDENDTTQANQLFLTKINDFINYLNATCYLGIDSKEFHYAWYPVGTFYKRHLDVFQNDSKRRLSIVCYLNEEDWQDSFGGQLAIYKEKKEVLIAPKSGRMVVFESHILEHEVKTVSRDRFSITGWLKTR
jgi:SM-20-related protein